MQVQRSAFERGTLAHAWLLGTFTYRELADASGAAHDQLRRYMKGWIAKGLVERIDPGRAHDVRPYNTAVFRAVHRALPAETDEGPQEKLWRTARALRTFSVSQLRMHSQTERVEVTPADAREFCRLLLRAGLVTVRRSAGPGQQDERYALVQDTGPRPPQEVRINAIWDPNEGQFLHLPEVG